MTLKLILTRHAKSSWATAGIDDHDRPLNARGKSAVTHLGQWQKTRGHLPQEVLCSSATRTLETWSGIEAEAKSGALLSHCPQLYLASPPEILAVIGMATAPVLQVLGHNPGIAAMATALAQTPHDHPRFMDYPTGATTVFEFDLPSWANVLPRMGRIVDFAIPKEIEID